MVVLCYAYILSIFLLLFVMIKLLIAEKMVFRRTDKTIDLDSLPSVSVCIPARNETNAMTECLESVLSSDYPKFEVIVLDDNSTDNTSNLIRAFAHSGVRFVQGDNPESGWLGKNFALERLLDEASGDYVLFLDTDTRLEPKTLTRLITWQQSHKLKMVSIVPQRGDLWRGSVWFAPLRHLWEIVNNSYWHPAASPSAWLVDRSALSIDLDGFWQWKDEMQPELFIAREFAKTSDYRLVISSPQLGLYYERKWRSQISASIRLYASLFGRSKPRIFAIMLMLLAFLSPGLILIALSISRQVHEFGLAAAICLLSLVNTIIYARLIRRRLWWLAWSTMPIVLIQEIFILIIGAIRSLQGVVFWKERRIKIK